MQKHNPRTRKPKFRKVKKHVHVIDVKETCTDKVIEINTHDGTVYKTIGVHTKPHSYEIDVLRKKPPVNNGFPRNPYEYFTKMINTLRNRLDTVTGDVIKHIVVPFEENGKRSVKVVDRRIPKSTLIQSQIEKYESLRKQFIDSNPNYVVTF